MFENFCTQTARKIRKLGYARSVALFYARFFFASMLLVCAVMGVLSLPSASQYPLTTGSGIYRLGARAGYAVSDFSLIRS
ncbi:MAG: hypothetical protein WC391_08170 [Methanoregula sp.]|jgi:hypothetical protein